ncbi:hypothetical protein [uncultured Psychrobacillus sp.]|uniref:hypothetical protein n=1 Tax=uncultured Psychrobacillus sp. TaxID=1551585 RepID=UPI00260F2F16|nr:hypothetical protein [uncultured Psychrobacillus sp.]
MKEEYFYALCLEDHFGVALVPTSRIHIMDIIIMDMVMVILYITRTIRGATNKKSSLIFVEGTFFIG